MLGDEDWLRNNLRLSQRHRTWGNNVPAVDMDFIEYDMGAPKAIIEYKRSGAIWSLNRVNMRVLLETSERARLPLYVVEWNDADDASWVMDVHPVNISAQCQSGSRQPIKSIPEREFVDGFLHGTVRGRTR